MNGKYPMSQHAPGCEEYKQEEFAVVECGGSWCIVEKEELELFENYGEEYNFSTVMLTRDQFENLPEFDGF